MQNTETYPRYRWFVLTTASLAIMSCYMNVVAYAPLLGQIAVDLNVDTGMAMHLMSATYIVTAFILLGAGYICDRFGIRTALLAGLLLSTVPAVFVPWIGRNFSYLFTVRLLQGAAPAFVMVIVGPITGLWFPRKEQGLASGLMMGSLSIGAAIGLSLAPVLSRLTGSWETAIALLSVLGWLGIVLTFLVGRRPPVPLTDDILPLPSDVESSSLLRRAVSSPITWIGAFIFFFNAWGFHSLYALVPAYLSSPLPAGLGLGPIVAGKLSLALTLVGIVAVLAGGLFLDRVVKGNFRLVIGIGFVLTAVFSYLLLVRPVFESSTLLVLALLLAGWGMPFMSSSIIAFAVTTYPVQVVGRMLGWLGGLGTFGGAAGVYLGGLTVARTGTFHMAIGMISLTALAGLILSRFLQFWDSNKGRQSEAL
jgi:predicted MFS family arabinose efflux permease